MYFFYEERDEESTVKSVSKPSVTKYTYTVDANSPALSLVRHTCSLITVFYFF